MEQQRCSALHLVQPADASRLAAAKSLVLSSGPTFKRAINVLEDAEHGGPVECGGQVFVVTKIWDFRL